MKKLIILLLLVTVTSQAQLFKFREHESSFGDISGAVVINPYTSIKEGGLNIGVEIEGQIKPLYIRASLTSFTALKDNYTDFTVATGLNFSSGRFDQWRYYSGFRMGLIKRFNVFPTVGVECGINYEPWRSKIYYGIRATYDYGSDMDFYGDRAKQNGFILIGCKFN